MDFHCMQELYKKIQEIHEYIWLLYILLLYYIIHYYIIQIYTLFTFVPISHPYLTLKHYNRIWQRRPKR